MSKKATKPDPKVAEHPAFRAGIPEPMSPSDPDQAEDSDSEDDEENVLITPPDSVKKAPAKVKKPPAKTPLERTAPPASKQSEAGVKKAGPVKNAKDEGINTAAKAGKTPVAGGKVDGKPTVPGNAKPIATQTTPAKEDAAAKVDERFGVIMDPAVFSTQIFDIFTGPSKGHFMAHEAVLAQSPLLARLMQSQSNKKGKHKTTLVLLRESPANFGILLGYLYSHQLVMPDLNGEGSLNSDTDGTEAKAAAKVLARLYVLAHNYEMDGMQERITRVLEDTGLMERIPGLEFFELAEKLYPDDVDDAEDDEFAKHFVKVAPGLIRDIPDKDLPELMRMVSAGGAFAEAIFLAYNTAVKSGLGSGDGGVKIKREPEDEADLEAAERARKKARMESEGTAEGDAI